jgi:ribonuclease HII
MESNDLLTFERVQWDLGLLRIAGVDEAGRGPLIGSVVAAAVVFTSDFAVAEIESSLAGLTDSKQISENKRDQFFDLLQSADSVEIGVGIATAAEIDEINILRATHLAMKRAVENLPELPEYILVDGRPVPGLPALSTSIIKGDSRSLSIAAASIIAKVTRDRMMYELDQKYPQYGFAAHKGYGTKAHLAALRKHGPISEHRQSFRPVREASAEQFTQMELM